MATSDRDGLAHIRTMHGLVADIATNLMAAGELRDLVEELKSTDLGLVAKRTDLKSDIAAIPDKRNAVVALLHKLRLEGNALAARPATVDDPRFFFHIDSLVDATGKLYDAVADTEQTNRAMWGPSKDMETNASRLWQEFGSRVSDFFADATDRGVQHVAMPPGVKFAFDSAGLNVFHASGLHVTDIVTLLEHKCGAGTILGLIDYTAKSAATQGTEFDDWSKPLMDLASASRDLYEALHDVRYPRHNTVVKFAPTSAHIDLTMTRWAKFIAAARNVLGDELQSNAEQIVADHGADMFGGTQLLLHGRTAGEYKWFN